MLLIFFPPILFVLELIILFSLLSSLILLKLANISRANDAGVFGSLACLRPIFDDLPVLFDIVLLDTLLILTGEEVFMTKSFFRAGDLFIA